MTMAYLLINLDAETPQEGPNLLFGLFEFVVFDAVPESTNRRSAEVTQHPVEEGADVTDHVRPVPRELELIGVASNRPASAVDYIARTASYAGGNTTYAHDIYEQLNVWMDNGTLLTVLAVGDFYENMAIVSMERGHDPTKNDAVHVRLSLQEINVVATDTVDAPTPSTARGAKTKPKGQKATAPTEGGAAEEDSKTILKGLLG